MVENQQQLNDWVPICEENSSELHAIQSLGILNYFAENTFYIFLPKVSLPKDRLETTIE